MNDQEADKKFKLIENQCRFLMDSFDSVQIFCTKYEGNDNGNTRHFISGFGNYCARYGQVKEWILEQEGQAMEHGAKREHED